MMTINWALAAVIVMMLVLVAILLYQNKKKHSKRKPNLRADNTTRQAEEIGGWLEQYWRTIVTTVVCIAVAVVGFFVIRWLWTTDVSPNLTETPLKPSTEWPLTPTPRGVWEFFKNYWFWSIFVISALFFGLKSLPSKWAGAARGLVVVIAVTLVGAMIVHGLWNDSSSSSKISRSQLPLTSLPPSEWPRLVIPAKGRSELLPSSIGMVIVMNGNNFRLVNVYQDGSECKFGDRCPLDRPTKGVYAINKANETNIVSYAYAKN